MSNSFNDSSDTDTKDRQTARAQFNSMFAGGRSFSGRERNCCYLNTANEPAALGKFANISGASGLDYPDDGRALAVVDWDQDGDLDLWASNRNAPRLRFMRNNSPNSTESLAIRLIGDGKSSNRDAIGARVELVFKNRQSDADDNPSPEETKPSSKINGRIIKTLRAGEGFLSQSSKWLHFGIPPTRHVGKIIVDWPGGNREIFSDMQGSESQFSSGRYILRQNSGVAKKQLHIDRNLRLRPELQVPEERSDGIFRMATYVELPPLAFETWKGKKQPIRAAKGENLLVLFWASWCPSCLQELKEIADHEQEIRSAGLDILALSVDGLKDDPLQLDQANKILNSLGFYFRSGRATPALIQRLQSLNILKTENNELPLPFSILLDYRSRFVALHRGPVAVSQLLDASEPTGDDLLKNFELASSLGGSSLSDTVAHDALRRAEADGRFKYAHQLQQAGLLAMAARQYEKVLEVLPESEKALMSSASILGELGQLEKAKVQLEKLLTINPDSADARMTLGGVYLKKNKLLMAKKQYDQAIRLAPEDPRLFFNRAIVNTRLNSQQDALDDFNAAIIQKPDFTEAQFQRGLLLEKMGRPSVALHDFDDVILAKPKFGMAYKRRGIARFKLGMLEESLHDFSQAIKLLPPEAELYNNRGMAYTALRNYGFAITDYKRALEVNQEEAPQVFNNLAWLLATCADSEHRNGELALQYAKQACELSQWSYYGALDTLAAAYAEVGRFEDAIRWQKRAIAYAPEENKPELQQRLDLYEKKQPYRTTSN